MAKSRTQKREEAIARNEKWQSLTPEQQLLSLNKRKLSAKRQRARISKVVEKSNAKVN